MSRIQSLYRLQMIDSQIDEAKHNLARIAANLGKSKALIKAEKITHEAEQALHQAQAKMRDLDLEVKSLATKIATNEKKLYEGKSTSAKEAANLQEEVNSLKKRLEKREESLLEAMVISEQAERVWQQAQTELTTIKEKAASDQEKLQHLQTQLQTKVSNLIEQRPSIIQYITAEDVKAYEQLRAQKGGRAVTEVAIMPEINDDAESGYVCLACNVSVSHRKVLQARTGTELTYCSTCGRMLYVA